MKKGLIFDMDGTLWDSSENVARSWDRIVKKAGYPSGGVTTAEIQSVMGKTMVDIADTLFAEWDKEKRMALLRECCEDENAYLKEHGGVLYPMLWETLEALKKEYHLYIVSNCQSGYIEAFLDHYGRWDLFEDIECFGNNLLTKDKNIRLLYERNGLEDAAYVGDIQGDCDATEKAGLKFIHAAYGFGTIDHEVPAVSAFEELLLRAPQIV